MYFGVFLFTINKPGGNLHVEPTKKSNNVGQIKNFPEIIKYLHA